MDFSNYVKTEKKRNRKEKVDIFNGKIKSLFGSVWLFVIKHPYQISMSFILSTITSPFLATLLDLLFIGEYKNKIGVYLLSTIIIILIIEMAAEEEFHISGFSWFNVSRCFTRDFFIFLSINIVTFLHGHFVLFLIYNL